MVKILYRASKEDSMVAGVCAGYANYIDVDPTIMRLVFVALIFASGFGLFLYLISWIVVPRKEEKPKKKTSDKKSNKK